MLWVKVWKYLFVIKVFCVILHELNELNYLYLNATWRWTWSGVNWDGVRWKSFHSLNPNNISPAENQYWVGETSLLAVRKSSGGPEFPHRSWGFQEWAQQILCSGLWWRAWCPGESSPVPGHSDLYFWTPDLTTLCPITQTVWQMRYQGWPAVWCVSSDKTFEPLDLIP